MLTKTMLIGVSVGYHCQQVKFADQVIPPDDMASQNAADVSSKTARSGSWSPNKKKKARPVADKTLRCDICPYRTNKLGLLTIHKTYHHPQAKNTNKCPHCPYYVCAPRLLHQHIRIHVDTAESVPNGDARAGNGSKDQESRNGAAATKADAMQLRCSICPYVGRTKNDVIYHRQFHRARSTAPYRCPRCPFWVSDKRLLAQHLALHREPSRPLVGSDVDGRVSTKVAAGTQCDGKTVTSPCNAPDGSHLSDLGGKAVARPGTSDGRRRRVARTLWRCDRCPYVTAKRSQHRTHRQLHGSGQRHTCRLCDYSVGGLHLLMQHVRLHHRQETDTHAEPHRAQDPPEDTQTNSPLKDLRPVFRCDRCPYSNSRRDHLLCHARFHSSDGPLRCPQCDYSVSKVHLLTQHLRVHQLSADFETSSKTGAHAAKDQFMKSLSLTTR